MANNKFDEWSLTLLRVIVGAVFAYHGYFKLFVKGGFTGTVSLFTLIGIPLPAYSTLFVALVELIGGLLLLVGLLTKWTTIVFIFEMLFAFFRIRLKNGFLVSKGGYEFVLLILAALIVVLVNGPGKFSLGKKIFKNKN